MQNFNFEKLRLEVSKVMEWLDIVVCPIQQGKTIMVVSATDAEIITALNATADQIPYLQNFMAFYNPEAESEGIYVRNEVAHSVPDKYMRGLMAHELVHSLQGITRLTYEISEASIDDPAKLETRVEMEAYTISAFFEIFETAEEVIEEMGYRAALKDLTPHQYLMTIWIERVKPMLEDLMEKKKTA